MPLYGNEANFSRVVSLRMFEQNLADLFGVSMYSCLTYLKLHYLSPKHLDVTSFSSVPTFRNFSENRLFLDSN